MSNSNFHLLGCTDINIDKAKNLSKNKIKIFDNYIDLIRDSSIDAVIIATLHDSLASITKYALENKKHVFVEKPAARNYSELKDVLKFSNSNELKIRIGLNHRFHPGILKAKELIQKNQIGPLMFIRARYGHGARINYEKEWRANPNISGGGELIDQGPHLIDLASWFFNEQFSHVEGYATNYFWQMPVDDNCFMNLRTKTNKTAFLHVSCTEWKNLFSFEIYGKNGKIEINGLGGSYGTEKVTFYKMLPQMGPPETMIWEYPFPDRSWELELNEFYKDISQNRIPDPGLNEVKIILEIINTIYKKSNYDFSS
jgi:predicted dehydrogenase